MGRGIEDLPVGQHPKRPAVEEMQTQVSGDSLRVPCGAGPLGEPAEVSVAPQPFVHAGHPVLSPSPNGRIFQVCSGPCPALSGFQAHPQAAEQCWPGAPGKLERVSPPHPLIPITAPRYLCLPPLDETLFPASIPRRTPVCPRDPPGGMVTGKPEQRPTGGRKESSTTGWARLPKMHMVCMVENL